MANKTNQVDVQLYDLTVTPDPNDYFGRVRSKGTLDNKAIASRIKKEGSEYQTETIRITSYNVCYTKLLRSEKMQTA